VANFEGLKNPPRDGALVIGGDGHSVLAIVRSLGQRGIPLWVACDVLPLAKHSRDALASMGWDDSRDPHRQAEWLLEMARKHRLEGWVLIAGSDASDRRPSEILDPRLHRNEIAALAERIQRSGVEHLGRFDPSPARLIHTIFK